MIKNFRNDCAGSSFIIQNLEIFPGTRYKNNKVSPVKCAKTLKREGLFIIMANKKNQENMTLNNLKKKILEQIVSEILQNGNMLDIKINNHFYNYVLDIIDIKT